MKTSAVIVPRIPGLLYGGDYNPEQWPESVWQEDVALMKEAGVNLVSVAIFAWARCEPRPGRFDFEWLDRLLDLLYQAGIFANLGTATANPPPWFSRLHPEALAVTAGGTRLQHGSRQHYAPASAAYRDCAKRLVERLAERYAEHPALASWHVNNEYGCHVYESFDAATVQSFRDWLERRYQSIERLNEAWGTQFWGQLYGAFDEVEAPVRLATLANPAHALDWRRFSNQCLLDLCRMEIEVLRRHSPGVPVTTNLLGLAFPLDDVEWGRELDFVSWDSYPDPVGAHAEVVKNAMAHEFVRSLKRQSFVLMEQATSHVNWRPTNAMKPPGMMRALSYQALARGADGVMFFQWRASVRGAERFHSAMLPHVGRESRVFKEVCALGKELQKLELLRGATVEAEIALLYDAANRWALNQPGRPARIDPIEECQHFYTELYARNLPVDFVAPEADLSPYKLVIVPALYLLTQKAAENLRHFVRRGGTLIVSYFSDIVDEYECVRTGGYLKQLRSVLGAWVEEWAALGQSRTQLVFSGSGQVYEASFWTELVHLEGAIALAQFDHGFLKGRPAITRNSTGAGTSYYVATRLGSDALARLLEEGLERAGIDKGWPSPGCVEVCRRKTSHGDVWIAINHSSEQVHLKVPITNAYDLLKECAVGDSCALEPYGVVVMVADSADGPAPVPNTT